MLLTVCNIKMIFCGSVVLVQADLVSYVYIDSAASWHSHVSKLPKHSGNVNCVERLS